MVYKHKPLYCMWQHFSPQIICIGAMYAAKYSYSTAHELI